MKVNAVGAASAPIFVVALGVLGWRFHEEDTARAHAEAESLRADLATVKAGVAEITAAPLVGESAPHILQDCRGFNDRMTCVMTNLSPRPVSMCWTGGIVQKNGGGTMKASGVCTGRVGPRETREASVPWDRGHAEDICNKVGPYGSRLLDWEACEFVAKPVEPATESGPLAQATAPAHS
jgi:hypothetical protein